MNVAYAREFIGNPNHHSPNIWEDPKYAFKGEEYENNIIRRERVKNMINIALCLTSVSRYIFGLAGQRNRQR